MELLHRAQRCGRDARLLRLAERLPERDPVRVGLGLQPRERGVADPAPRPVRDPLQRDGVVGVVDRLQVGDHVLRPRRARRSAGRRSPGTRRPGGRARPPAPATARSSGRRPRSRCREAFLDERGDLGGDEARLGVLVLDLERAHRLALAELRPEVLRLALAVVLDHRVRGLEDRVRRAVVLLERDRSSSRRSRARTRGCCGCRRRGTRRSTGPGRRPRRRCGASRPAAAAAGTARGSCPGTRRRGRSGTPSASVRAPRGSARAPATVSISRSSKSTAFEANRRRW